MRRVMLVALLVALLPVAAGAQGGAAAAVTRADEAMVRALVAGDAAAVGRGLADDYLGVQPNGLTTTKAETVADLRSGKLKFEKIDVTERQVRVYGDTAVITGRETMKGRSPAGPFDMALRFTAVYTKRGNNWLEVAFQGTTIAK